MPKPNVLLIVTDQQSYSAMSCAGNTELHTPAMDRLAAEGVRFSQAHCTYPLCTPSRASLFTGHMPHTVGVRHNGEGIEASYNPNEIGPLAGEQGYDCAYGGKWHVPEIAMPDGEHGFRTICGFDDTNLADRCIDYFQASGDRPFFLVASFDNPHNICEWARNQVLPWGPIEQAATEDCPNLPLNHAIPAFEPEAIRLVQSWQHRPYPVRHFDESQWRQYRHAYYRLVEKVDTEIGRILDALERTGKRENTLIVFTSDHGDGMGAHRWSQKSITYDEVVRVPLIISVPGKPRAGVVDTAHLVSNGLDLLPTLCDYAGLRVPEGLPGASLRPLVEGHDPSAWRDQLVIESELSSRPAMSVRMVRTPRFKYSVYSYGRNREQLVDMQNDPGEMVNLAVERRHQDTLDEHRRRLYEWCLETGDLFEDHYSHPGQPVVPGYGPLERFTDVD